MHHVAVDKGRDTPHAAAMKAGIEELFGGTHSWRSLATALGVSHSTLLRSIERGTCSMNRLDRIASELGVPTGFLLIRAGYVDNVDPVEKSIAADKSLGKERQLVLSAVRMARDLASGRGRGS